MTPELYEQICHICYEALQFDATQRSGYLDQACNGHELLRREVESLLAYEGQEKSFLAAPATPIAVESLGGENSSLLINDQHASDPYLLCSHLLADPFGPGITLGGRYLIEKELSRGGISAVFLARDRKLYDMPVVIKVLLKTCQHTPHKLWYEKKFMEEIKALARIDHPGVVRALDVGELPDGRSYLVMQYVAGETLRNILNNITATGGMELGRVAKLIDQIGQALTAAHQHGVIHRDLKPENIMVQEVGDKEYVKLIDFGISTVQEMADAADNRTTVVVGTPSYLAPEQLLGRPIPASDIYALGVVAFEMVTGRQPFAPESIVQLYELQRARICARPCELRPDLPEAAQSAILKALSFAPDDRFSNAKDFVDALANTLTANGSRVLLSPQRSAYRRHSLLIPALIVVMVISILFIPRFAFRKEGDREQAEIPPLKTSERYLSYSMEVQRDPNRYPHTKKFNAFDNVIFGAGDEVRFYVSSPQSGFLYVINEGPAQTDKAPNFNILFPDTETNNGSPEIRVGQTMQIPPPSRNQQQDWFVFDEEEGVESIWFIWSGHALPELEAIKSWANPKDQGEVRDPKQRTTLSHYLAALSAIKPEVEIDEASKQTNLKGNGETLVWLMKLEHR